jgi:hypothetical protein
MPAKGLIRIIALSGFVSLISYNSNSAMAAGDQPNQADPSRICAVAVWSIADSVGPLSRPKISKEENPVFRPQCTSMLIFVTGQLAGVS